MVAHELRLKLHTVFEEQVSGALQVWRIIHCRNILILELEERFPSGSTPQSQGLDIFAPMSQIMATIRSPPF